MGVDMSSSLKDRRAVLGGILSLGGVFFTQSFLPGAKIGSYEWLEIVQDKYNPEKWYINRYEGPEMGSLETSVLKSHRIELGKTADSGIIGPPARTWFADGKKEQGF